MEIEQWNNGTGTGTMEQWNNGTKEQWNNGKIKLEQWNNGIIIEQRNNTTMEQLN